MATTGLDQIMASDPIKLPIGIRQYRPFSGRHRLWATNFKTSVPLNLAGKGIES
jgi:hypothetical protein